MLKICASLINYTLLIFGILAARESINATTISTVSEFLGKFHQNDYKFQLDWAELVSCNKQYVKSNQFRIFKYNRTTAVCNATFDFNVDINNELEVVIQAYKFASNEYRLFPIRFQVNFCQASSANIMGYSGFYKCGNCSCPLVKGIYHFCNWAPEPSMFPPFIPDGKYKVEVKSVYRSAEISVHNFYGTVSRPIVRK